MDEGGEVYEYEERLAKRRTIENLENEVFFKKVADTIKDGKLIYKMLCECVRKRFSLDKVIGNFSMKWKRDR